jgi:MFS family permease
MSTSMTQAQRSSHFGFRFVTPLALGSTLNPINSTMISTALAPIAVAFSSTVAQTGWLIAGLYLTSAIAQPMMGRLADLFGPRRIYLISLMLVAIAGVIGALAPSLAVLVGARVLLGVGTSGAYPSAMGLFRSQGGRHGMAPPRLALGALSFAGFATTALGPLLGGLITGAFGWHAIFTVNVPLAFVAACMVVLWVPRDTPRTAPLSNLVQAVDLPGVALFSAALILLMTFLMNLDHLLWWTLPLLGLFWIGLTVHSLRRGQPFIDVRMLAKNLPLTISYLRIMLFLTTTYCILYGFAQWLESCAHYCASAAGLMALPMSILAGICSLIAARSKGLRPAFIIGAIGSLIGCACLIFVHSNTPAWLVASVVMFFGVPMGMTSTAAQAAIYVQASASEIGMAAGLQRTFSYVGAILAASLLGIIYGHQPSDSGIHALAIAITCITVFLLIFTVFDRTVPDGSLE